MKLKKTLLAFVMVILVTACSDKHEVKHRATNIDWREQIIYMALTDRFYDGDTSNNNVGGYEGYDPNNPYFYHGGDITGISQKLGYLSELGTTVLWTSPLYENVPLHAINSGRNEERDSTPACGYHGYVINFRDPDDQAVEPHFGTPQEVKFLINELEYHNMTLIFDMVVNQAGWNADIVKTHPEWFNKLEDNEKDNSCAYLDVTHMCIYGLPDFKIDDPVVGADIRNYLNEMSKGWVRNYDISGIRFDAPMLVPKSYFSEWFKEIRSVKPDLFIFAETYDYRRSENYKSYLDAGFNGTLNFYLQGGLKETFAKGNSTDIIADNMQNTIDDLGIKQTLLMVNFIDNHDIARFATKTEGSPGVYSNDEKRHQLGLTALLTLPGIPQIYYGNELGAYGGYPNNRRDMPEWGWNKETRSGEHDWFLPNADKTFGLTKRLIELRKNNYALTHGYYFEVQRQNDPDKPNVYAFLRRHNTNRILVLINNDDKDITNFELDINKEGKLDKWDIKSVAKSEAVELLGMGAQKKLTIEEGKTIISIPAKCAGVYEINNYN